MLFLNRTQAPRVITNPLINAREEVPDRSVDEVCRHHSSRSKFAFLHKQQDKSILGYRKREQHTSVFVVLANPTAVVSRCGVE